MSELNPFDQFFRDKLRDHASETPMHLWAGVQAKQKRNAYRFLGVLATMEGKAVALGLLMGLSGMLLYLFQPQPAEVALRGQFPIEYESFAEETVAPVPDISALLGSTPAREVQKATETFTPNAEKSDRSKQNNPRTQAAVELILDEPGMATKEIFPEPTLFAQPESEGSNAEALVPQAFLKENRHSHEHRILAPIPSGPGLLSQSIPQLIGPDDGCHGFKKHKWSIMADAVIAPEVAIRSLSSKDVEYAAYAGQRNETERASLSYSLGLRLTALSSTGLGVRSGLNFTQINEDFSYRTENEERIEIITIKDQFGNIIGTDTTFWYGGVDYGTRNRYRSFDIPLMIGYELERQNLTLSVYGGVLFNVLFDARGGFLSPDNIPSTFSNRSLASPHQVYRTDVGLSMMGSIGLHYRLSTRVKLLLEPQLRYFTESITRSDYPLNQGFLVAGVQTGLRYQLK